MSSKAGGAGSAPDAEVVVGAADSHPDGLQRDVDEAQYAVDAIAAKLEGWKQSLADAKATLKDAQRRLNGQGN